MTGREKGKYSLFPVKLKQLFLIQGGAAKKSR
jgi:hypothetical protein